MRLRVDWFAAVPYVPTLGVVHPAAVTQRLLADVVAVNGTGVFLPYDHGRRWAAHKDESILLDAVLERPAGVVIPTLSRCGGGTVTVYDFGGTPDLGVLGEMASRWAGEHGAGVARIRWFQPAGHTPDVVAGVNVVRILLETFHTVEPLASGVRDLAEAPGAVRGTFSAFTHALAAEGFAFLHERMRAGAVEGPVLVAVEDGRVVGAIGPMQTMPDPVGARRLLPQYFGVLPEARGRGHGRALWRAAVAWGAAHGAAYQLLQAQVGGASERICLTEGLTTLGFVFTRRS